MNQTITPPRPSRLSRRAVGIIAAAGVLFLAVGVWLVSSLPDWLERRSGSVTGGATTKSEGGAPAGDARKIQALLFYVTADGAELQASTQDVLYGATPAEQARRIIEAQIQAPAGGRLSAVPAGTQVRSVFVGSKGDAYVDFSPEIRSAHPGGSLNEALAVFTIVNALTSNLPGITSVQILVDGKEVDSLAGHIDLRHPLGRADGWVRKGQ